MWPPPNTVSTILRRLAWGVLLAGIINTYLVFLNGGSEAGWSALYTVLEPAVFGWALLLGFSSVLTMLIDILDEIRYGNIEAGYYEDEQ